MTSYLLNSENVWRAHREPVDSRSPRLNGPGPTIPSTARNTVFAKAPGDGASAVPASRTFFLALLLLLLRLLCRSLFRLLHRLAELFDRFDGRRFQAILRNIPPHRRVIQRVLQSSSLKHHEGVVFRSSFHPCMRWLWRGSLPRQIRRTPLLRTDPYLIVCCLDRSGTCIDRPAIDCRIRSLPRAFSHTNNQVRRVLIERQPITPPLQERFLYFFLALWFADRSSIGSPASGMITTSTVFAFNTKSGRYAFSFFFALAIPAQIATSDTATAVVPASIPRIFPRISCFITASALYCRLYPGSRAATYIFHAIPKEHRWNLGRVGPWAKVRPEMGKQESG